MEIKTLQIKDLKPDPNNARQHDDKNLKAIQGSLKQFGQRKPIVITEDRVIVAGNGTVEAAKRLGWSEIQTVQIPGGWSPEQTKAFALADNRTAELAAWSPTVLSSQLLQLKELSFDVEALGFTETTVADFSRISSAQEHGSTDADKEWAGMPDYDNVKKDHAFRTAVYFPTHEDADNFFRLLGIKKSKVFWYPEFDGLVGSSINEQYVIEQK